MCSKPTFVARLKRRMFIILVLFSNAFCSPAQVESMRIDSMKMVLASPGLSMDDRMQTHQELGIEYLMNNLDSAFAHNRKALSLEKRHPNLEMRMLASNSLGRYYDLVSDSDSAMYFYLLTRTLAKKLPSPEMEVIVLNNLGLLHLNLGETDPAKKYFEEGYLLGSVLLEKGVDQRYDVMLRTGLSANRTNMGMIAYIGGDYASALRQFDESLRMYKELDNGFGQLVVYKQMGLIFGKMGNYSEARRMFTEALHKAESIEARYSKVGLFLSLCSVERRSGNFAAAHKFLRQAFSELTTEDPEHKIGTYYTQKGLLHCAEADYEQALISFLEAKRISTDRGWDREVERNNLYAVPVLLALEQFDEARKCLQSADSFYRSKQDDLKTAEALKLWAQYYELIGAIDSAYIFSKKYIAVKDSLVPQNTVNQISTMYARFWTEQNQHDLQLALKNKELVTQAAVASQLKHEKVETQQRFVIVLLLVGGLFIVVAFRLVLQRRKNKIQRELLESELKALRAQMNPHFLFNTLSSVQGLITENKIQSASSFLSRCTKLTRRILEQSENGSVTLESELETVELYIELEAMRAPFSYQIKIDPNLDLEWIQVPSMLLQPYVENAIKHGIMPLKDKGHLLVDLQSIDGQLLCVIEDNGVGRKAAQQRLSKHRSMGIKITSERLDKQPNGAGIQPQITDLYNADGNAIGTRVQLVIPMLEPEFT